MKIHITENVEKSIVGFSMIPVIYGKVELDIVPDNGAVEIFVENLDQINYDNVEEFLVNIRNKTRKNGTVIISGTELSLLSRNVAFNKITSKDFNSLITNKRGIHKVHDIVNLLKLNGLMIQDVMIKGNTYGIKASRP